MIASVELQVISKLLVCEDQCEIDKLLSYSDDYYSVYSDQIQFIRHHVQLYLKPPDVFTFQSEFPDIDLVQVNESLEYLDRKMKQNRQRILLMETFNKLNDLDSDDVSEAWKYIGNQYEKASELESCQPMDIVHQTKERSDQIVEFSKQKRIPTGFKEIDELMYGGLSTVEELLVIIARTNSGKAQPLWSKVLTPNGWISMRDIQVGDTVVGKDNDNGKVVQIFPQGVKSFYKVYFDDGTYAESCGDHLWTVLSEDRREESNENYNISEVLTTDYIAENIENNYSIDMTEPIEFNSNFNESEELDSYLLGVIISNGCIKSHNITIANFNNLLLDDLVGMLDVYNCVIDSTGTLSSKNKLSGQNFIEQKLSDYGILDTLTISNRFIPKKYLTAPVSVRLSLLSGLVDSIGYIGYDKKEVFWVLDISGAQLSSDILELIQSLGIFVKVIYKENDVISLNCRSTFNPFHVLNKASTYSKLVIKTSKQYQNCRHITSIEYVGETECQCILLDNESHTYLTDNYTVTHNTWVCTEMMESAHANGFPVLYYSPEMQSSYLATRFDTWKGHFQNNELFIGKYSKEYLDYLDNLKEGETPAIILEDKDLPQGVSVASLTPLVRQYKIKLLIIDGLSYMKDDQNSPRDYEKYKNICTGLFSLSKQYGCAVVVTMQANRATAETRDENGEPFPSIYNAEGSDHPARIATQVFAIRQIFETHTLDIRLEKTRNAVNVKPVLSYVWDVNTGRTQYMPNNDNIESQLSSNPSYIQNTVIETSKTPDSETVFNQELLDEESSNGFKNIEF